MDHHRRPACVRRQGGYRQFRRRSRRTRLRRRVRCRDRQEALEVLPDAESGRETRSRSLRSDHADDPQDLVGRGDVEAARRRRQPMGFDRLRPRAQADLRRHRQFQPAHAVLSQPWRRRQPVRLLDRRAPCRGRQLCLALPDGPGRGVGLHLHQLDRQRRPQYRRQAPQGHHAGAEGRVLLCSRPQDRQADRRQALCEDQLDAGAGQERPPDSEPGGALQRRAGAGLSGAGRGAQLVPDGLQPAHEAGLFPGLPVRLRLCP